MAGRKLASVQSVHDVAPIEKPGACKTLVVGDLHCKMSLVLPRVTDTALSHCCDSVVLLGDLCDDWGVDGPWFGSWNTRWNGRRRRKR